MPTKFGIRTMAQWHLPSVCLDGWQARLRELTFPPGVESPKYTHRGFVLGYVLEGQFRFRIEGQPEELLSVDETFYEKPGSIHLPSSSASSTKSVRVLVVGFGKKGTEFTRPL
jgi:quercetin dioxygenase-like cupin family protein